MKLQLTNLISLTPALLTLLGEGDFETRKGFWIECESCCLCDPIMPWDQELAIKLLLWTKTKFLF